MNRKAMFLLSVTAVVAVPAFADFSYEQTSKITGGAVASMMRMAGPFAAKAKEPQTQTVMVKGNRMATIGKDSMTVVDIDARTITDVHFDKKTYTVLTFDQMKQIYQEMQKRLQSPDYDMNAQFKVDVKETGAHKQIAGHDAREVVTRMEMEAKDPKTGTTATTEVLSNIWLTTEMAGYKEVREFYKRMAEAIGWMPGQMQTAQPGVARGMVQVTREISKMEGVPLLQITKMTGPGGMPDLSAAQQQGEKPQAQSGDDVSKAAAEAAQRQAENEALSQVYRTGGTTGRIAAGALGGMMGGLKRSKKPAEPPPPPPAKETPAAPAAPATPTAPGTSVLLEMTTEMSNHSSAAVDASRMAVPAGFKQVENEALKALDQQK